MPDGGSNAADTDGDTSDDDTPDGARFLCDAMCGKLATYLRMCGHDVAYALDRGVEADGEVLRLARAEERCLLTRDRDLARRAAGSATGDVVGSADGDAADDSDATRSRVVDDAAIELTEREIEGQLREVVAAGVDVTLPDRPRRCGTCNGRLRRLEPGTEPDHAPADDPVWGCVECGQAFWRGSHWADVRETLADVRTEVDESADDSRGASNRATSPEESQK